jgi:PAS domain S-box-containing protein
MTGDRVPRASEDWYRAIFDLANDAIFLHDAATGAILGVNRKMTEMYGCTREEALGLSIEDLSANEPPYTQSRALALLHQAMAGSVQVFEWLAKDRSGRTFWVEVSLKRIALGGQACLLANVRDIADRKRGEQSLREADARVREQAALARLGEMAAVIAHEVKNPLAGVRGAIQIIGGRLPPGSKEAAIIGDVIARIDALDELMKDLLLFARPPQLHPGPIDLVALAQETCLLVGEDPAGRHVRFDVEGMAPPIQADAKLLRIVLLNLLLNAAQATPARGTIRTTIAVRNGSCLIRVADGGAGIPPALREQIFVPFFTTKAHGTGLGLPTARRFVDAHGGRLTVECPPEGGTTVTIELPREPEADQTADER